VLACTHRTARRRFTSNPIPTSNTFPGYGIVCATKDEIMNTIHAHPTLSEAIMEAAGQAGGHGK
jgi:hypothetical protein